MYILTNKVNNKKYIGVTNNFERRFIEHQRSKYNIGKALREYGKDNFKIELIPCDTKEEAYELEGLSVTLEDVNSGNFYNMIPGGIVNNFEGDMNPMRRNDVKDKHPSLFTSEANPMKDPELREKNQQAQKLRKVLIGDTVYFGVREAARQLGMSRQKLIHRIKSNNFPDHQYWDH